MGKQIRVLQVDVSRAHTHGSKSKERERENSNAARCTGNFLHVSYMRQREFAGLNRQS